VIAAGSTILIATRNTGKTREFREAFQKLGIIVKDLHDLPAVPPIEETGITFAENALLKAKTVADMIGLPVLADDSGLCVDALNGAPGVYSARYAGEDASDEANKAKLLRELGTQQAVEYSDRGSELLEFLSSARFVCTLVLYDPDDCSQLQAEGSVEGYILRKARGTDGFGYDPLFWVSSHSRTMAELSLEEKNAISHRGLALRRLLEMIG
jgi:XTP/dITP diphosphohydrolase